MNVRISLGRVIVNSLLIFLLSVGHAAAAAETALQAARDLAAEAKLAGQFGMPLIVLVSLSGCPHCEVVRRSHLLPLLNDGQSSAVPVVRQVELNGRQTLRDFKGMEMSHGEFARRQGAAIAPVVFFFDKSGASLAQPLRGSMLPDFYGAYFESALSEARKKLAISEGNR